MPSLPSRSTAIWKIAVPLLCLAAGAAGGFAARGARCSSRARRLTEVREGGYRYVNPLLECEAGPALIQSEELVPFRGAVESHIRDRLRLPGLRSASVYFRELNDGLWFAVGENDQYAPASLRKVPLMIALLKQSERDPGLLQQPVPFRLGVDHNATQDFPPSVAMDPGQVYSVAELIRRMIVYSDNNAFLLLSRVVDMAELDRTYAKLGLSASEAAEGSEYLSVETYASFFRFLFNASYLSKTLSDQALELLARSEFRSGIVKGVPSSLPVAHKFGEHRDVDGSQLHDCGIVYYPEHPYLLCIMTRGSDLTHLDDAIASISRVVYDEVAAQHATHH